MRNIKLFETVSAFTEAYNGEEYIEPWVSYTLENEHVDYNKGPGFESIPLTFEITGSGVVSWKGWRSGQYYPNAGLTIYYNKNGEGWTEIINNEINVQAGDIVQFKGEHNYYSSWDDMMNLFATFQNTTCNFKVYGNIMSMIYSDDFIGHSQLPSQNRELVSFPYFFGKCTGLTDASNLILGEPDENDTESRSGGGSYFALFSGCTQLEVGPALPFKKLSYSCYESMFYGCTSLTQAPELPATALTNDCYAGMFWGCTSLTTAPVLPATTLTNYCYSNMFNGCTSLNYIKCLATNISASGCLNNWVSSVQTTSGTFVKVASMTGWPTGVDGIPTNWTVQDAS